jgi:exonuclease SbcC
MTQSGASSGTVGLSFRDQEGRYQLFRSTYGEVQLRRQEEEGWRILFTGKRSADEDLRQMFHLSYHHLAAAAFLREGEIFEFLARQPSNRRDILYALLGIDRLMEVRQRFIEGRRIAKREERRLQDHQRSLRVTTVKTHQKEIQQIEEELKNLEAEYEKLSSKAPEDSDVLLIAELTQTHSRLQQRLDGLSQERASVLSGFTDAAHMREAIREIDTAISEAQGLEAKREKIIQQVGSLTSQIQTLDASCETLRRLIDNNQGHCPTCHQPVQQGMVKQMLEEKESERAKCQKKLDGKRKTLDEHTTNVNALRELNQRHQLLSNKVEMLDRIETQLSDVQREFKGVADRLSALQPTAPPQTDKTADSLLDPVQIAERRRQLKYRIDNLRRRLVKLNKEEAVITHKLEELQRVQIEADQILRTRLSFELACAGVEKTIETLQHQILQPAEAELQRWLKRMNLFQSAKVDLKSQHLLPSLNIDGSERSLMLLSGSEKMILYLCFKAALSKVLGNPGFFIFDDPTLHLDGERKSLMIEFIGQLAEDHQVIVTSNDADMQEVLTDAHLIETKRDM